MLKNFRRCVAGDSNGTAMAIHLYCFVKVGRAQVVPRNGSAALRWPQCVPYWYRCENVVLQNTTVVLPMYWRCTNDVLPFLAMWYRCSAILVTILLPWCILHINRGPDYQPVIPSFVTKDGGPVESGLWNSRPPTPEPGDPVGTSPDPGQKEEKTKKTSSTSSNLGETMD